MNSTSITHETTTSHVAAGNYAKRTAHQGVVVKNEISETTVRESKGEGIVVYSHGGRVSYSYNASAAQSRALRNEIAHLLEG